MSRALSRSLTALALSGALAISSTASAGQPSDPPVGASQAPAASSDDWGGEISWQDETSWQIPGEYIIDFRDEVDSSTVANVLKALSIRYRPSALEEDTRIEIARIPGAAAQVLAKLRGNPDIEHVEPLTRMRALFVPNDPLYKQQWHMKRVQAEQAWGLSVGRGVTVAVVDTGIACETFGGFTKATDLAGTRCVEGYNFVARNAHANDNHGHGTHVAGTIAQSTNNGLGTAGLAFETRLMPVKVLSGRGWGTNAQVADGIRWAADNGAQVINLSLGGPFRSRVIDKAVAHAISRGAVVVASAGNSAGKVGYPAACEGVIGVSATDQSDQLAWFSSRGQAVDIGAPGVDVLQQTICNGGKDRCEVFDAFNGTSMASPHVAGAAALLVGLGVNEPAVVEQTLKDTAKPLGNSDYFGAGLLQAHNATHAVVTKQLGARLAALLALMLVALRWARRRGEAVSIANPKMWFGGLLSGVGLLFFAPWVLSRHDLWVDILSRPMAEWDLLVGASLHRFLPLAHVGVPLLLSAMFLGKKGASPLLGGLSLGTGAYLVSVAMLGQLNTPFGSTLTVLWCGLNAVGCLYLASLLLSKRKA